MTKFLNSNTLTKRQEESARILKKHPTRIPIICERSTSCTSKYIMDIDKTKYLVPMDMLIGQFIYVVRKRIDIAKNEALFIFVNNRVLPPSSELVANVYSQYKDNDGFLYMQYNSENTFG